MMTKHLFPTTTYHYNSGGEPSDILDLSYQQLLEFYQSHYHPSNAFMTFGDIPAAEHHASFESLALRSERLDIHIKVEDGARYAVPIMLEYYEVAESLITRHTSCWDGYLATVPTSWNCLKPSCSSILMENSASPLLKFLKPASSPILTHVCWRIPTRNDLYGGPRRLCRRFSGRH